MTPRKGQRDRPDRPGPDRPGHDMLEHRLREALEARSRTVGRDDLRRASPPSLHAVPRIPLRVRRTALTLFGLAAAVACVLLVLVPGDRRPAEPARPPDTSQTQTPSPAPTPSIAPSPVAPGAADASGAADDPAGIPVPPRTPDTSGTP
jgi:hypothetical protein